MKKIYVLCYNFVHVPGGFLRPFPNSRRVPSHFRLLTSALHTKILSRLKKKNSALQKTSATKILLIKIERENGGGDDDACIGIGIDEMPSEDNWCL
jgi:hypothetical protein